MRWISILIMTTLTLAAASAVAQQDGEWGDAPEGALAYPSLGVIGAFPTCLNVGAPGTIVYHGPLGWSGFGPLVDFEPDGNAGSCPIFAPYDLDECYMDGDAGLLFPGAFTIVGGAVVPCTDAGSPLGPVCTNAMWGLNLDIHVFNTMPVPGYVNVVMDWDQSGNWAPSNQYHCSAPEHVLVNFVVPVGFAGPLSALNPPPFLIGGNPGFVWTRFTISEAPVPQNWNGVGMFEDGESEDYLLLVDDSIPNETKSWSQIKGLYR